MGVAPVSSYEAYEFDTSLDPNYPVLTRGNAGEIMPDIVSPLSATVFFPPLERGWRRSFTETWDVMDWPSCPTTFAPIVGGRFYINISAFRRLADLTPGTSPQDIDRTLFAVGGVTLDRYEPPDEDGYAERGERIAATTAEFLANPPVERVAREHEQAQQRRRDGRANRAGKSSAELLDRIVALMQMTESDFVTLFIGSSVSPVVLGSLQAGLVEVYGEQGFDLARQTVMGLGGGGIESAEAGRALWELAALDGDEFEAAFERVLETYGFRGVNEWEIAAPSWEIKPEVLRRAVAAVRAGRAQRDPDAVREAALERFVTDDVRSQFPDLDLWLERCQTWMGIRERTKATCVLTINEQRLDALEIGRRLVDDGKLESADQVYLLTLEELTRAVSHGPVDIDTVRARRDAISELERYQEPTIAIAGQIPPVNEWPLAGGAAPDGALPDEITGAAASPGKATGLARVVTNAYADDPTEPGEILVAPITDPGWMPLFIGAVGVVTEMGGELSHTMIVSRELGIPAVVGAVGVTTAIKNGDLIEIDGSTGTVKILERA
jgi:rifampicin phosphotransferase